MGVETKSLEDAVAATLQLPARLTFVLIFLLLQIYALVLSVYKVSQENIPARIESPWQRWFIYWFFLGFLKRDKGLQNRVSPSPPVAQPASRDSQSRPNSNTNGVLQSSGTDTAQKPASVRNHEHALNESFSNNNLEPASEAMPTEDDSPSWTSLWVQGNTFLLFIIGIALSIPTFNKLELAQEGLNTENCSALIDGDIAGDGVRAALWVQQGILWLSVLTGAFLKPSQPRPTAVKELAAGLVVTHLSLAIAVLVQIGQGTLTPLDAAIVVMILDAQNAALAVSFSSRETLAARWEVVSVSASQLFGLVVIGVVLARFEDGRFVTADCGCFSFFWWAWQSSCTTSNTILPATERAVLWAYYAFRWLASAQNWHFGVRYMWIFNLMEQDKELWDGVEGTPGVPPTAGFGFLQNLVFGLVSSVSAELTIRGYTSGDEAKPFTVGQITAMVIAVTTTLRATWLFIRRFDLLPMVVEMVDEMVDEKHRLRRDFDIQLEGVTPGDARSDDSDKPVEPRDAAAGQVSSGDGEQQKDKGRVPEATQVTDVGPNVNTTPQPP